MREKFRNEHSHVEDEIRFFAEGAGVFYLRLGSDVYCIRCEQTDLLSVPAGLLHWFDMGPMPYFIVIRFFRCTNGWIAFSEDPIARRFPSFDDLAAEALAIASWNASSSRTDPCKPA